ncbi:MAG: DUF1080 domain-containing protein [Planctomycetota bacterium]
MSSLFRFAVSGVCCLALIVSTAALSAQEAPPGPPGEDATPSRPTNQNRAGNSKFARMGTSVGQSASKSGFEDLLESGDLSKFRGYKQEEIGAGWGIDGKYLHFDGTKKSGDIVTVETYGNFDLQFDWKVTDGGNSGVMYRVSLGDGAPYLSGPEYQVLDDTRHKDGENELTSAGSLYALYPPTSSKKRKSGVWNKARIVVEGNKITHYLNGKKVVDATIDSGDWRERVSNSKFKSWEKFGKNSEGHIAFQDHGDEVWYRNVKIKRLSGDTAVAKKQPARASNSKFQKMMQSAGGAGGPSEETGGRQQEDRSRGGRGEQGGRGDQAQGRPSGNSKFSRMEAQGPTGASDKKSDDKSKKDN